MMMLTPSLRGMLAPPAVSGVGRYDTIDLMRGVAAIAILFWHYQHFIALGLAAEGSRTGYPLHLLTLAAVMVLQLVNMRVFGRTLIYPMGGPFEFVRQLFLTSGWGPHSVFTFNGPVWSVSAEVLVYVFFWLLLPWLLRWGIGLPMAIALTARILLPGWPVAECTFYFFTGVTVFCVSQTASLATAGSLAATLLLAAIGICWSGRIGIGLYCGFVALTLACGLIDRAGIGGICGKVPWISENCYGSYLAHIPIQLAMILGLAMIGQSRTIAFSPYFLIAYLALVTVTARLLFLYVEKPARTALRRQLEAR